jgi:hypothetical protein
MPEEFMKMTELWTTDAPQRLGSVALEILMSGKPLSNKDVIATLIHRLEQEQDVLTTDTYRQLLEYVIYRTQGEIG